MLRLVSFWRTWTVPRAVIGLSTILVMIAAGAIVLKIDRGSAARSSSFDSEIKQADGKLRLTASQWSTVTVQPVGQNAFRS